MPLSRRRGLPKQACLPLLSAPSSISYWIRFLCLSLGWAFAAPLATVLSQAVSAVWVVAFLSGNRTILKLRQKDLKIYPSIMLPVLALGVSPFVMQATESVLFVSFNTSLLRYGGDIAVGAMTILSSIMQFMMLPLQGLTQGMQPIVSFNYGR